jgi:hypothetical protein
MMDTGQKPSNPKFDKCVGFLWVMGRVCVLGDGLEELTKGRDKRAIKVNNTYSYIILIMD